MTIRGKAAFCALTAAFAMAASTPLLAQEKSAGSGAATEKLIAESDKLRVLDIVLRPGDSGPAMSRYGQYVYYLSGGETQRTFADGSKSVLHRKTGDSVIVDEKRPYSTKNVGDTTIHIIVVRPK